MPQPVTLNRTLALPLMILYGLGATVGAGIYALLGEVAGRAGMLAPWSFLLAALLAAITAMSFAEMSSRFPRSAGEAVYVREGLERPALGTAVGILVAAAATVSGAAMLTGMAGYLGQLIPAPLPLLTLLPLLLLALTAVWGIKESALLVALFTLIEVGGLLLVIGGAWHGDGFATLPARLPELIPGPDFGGWHGIFAATLLAFFAFLGFEDMVNVAEEVVNVKRVMPLAIVATLLLTTLLYVLLALAAVLAISPAELGDSPAPLALLFQRSTGYSPTLINLVALFAISNGTLIQLILASRVLYGLADQGALPGRLAKLHPRTRTPLTSTLLVTVALAALALWFPLARLAEAASILILVIFALVNLSLWRLKRRDPRRDPEAWNISPWIPIIGFWLNLGFSFFGIYRLSGL